MKIVLLLSFFLLLSCGRKRAIEDFLNQINSNPNYNFKVVKCEGARPNDEYIVIKNAIDEKIFAVDIESYQDSNLDALSFFNNHLNDDLVVEIVHTYDVEEVHYKYIYINDELVYVPYTITVTEYVGDNGAIYNDKDENLKDLELIGSRIESISNKKLVEELVNQYGLSLDRATVISNIKRHYFHNSSKRKLSEKEMSKYFMALTGSEYGQAKKAFEGYLSGNKNEFEQLLRSAAKFNETTPEAMMNLIGQMFLQ